MWIEKPDLKSWIELFFLFLFFKKGVGEIEKYFYIYV